MKLLSMAAPALLAFTMVACSDDDDNNGAIDPNADVTAPKVVSVTPEDGATDLELIDKLVITYDEPVFRTPVTTIRVNGQYVDEGVVAEGNQLIIPIEATGNTTYKVEILKPSVRDAEMNFASDFTTTFSTKAYNMFDPTLFDITESPVNPDATEPTKKLYAYLKSQFGQKVLSGAMAEINWNTQNAEMMYETTGKYPAINTFDFVHHIFSAPLNPSNWIDYTNTQPVEDWFNAGGIVSCMWHWNVPASEAEKDNFDTYTFYDEGTDFTAQRATMSTKNSNGTYKYYEYEIFERDLNIIADYLLALQAKGIPVIWRPFHEASGNTGKYDGGHAWFWWGNGQGKARDYAQAPRFFKTLWKNLYNGLKARGVNNLIWVWTSNGVDADWYPGDEYVDIIACDYYENDATLYHNSLSTNFNELIAITNKKMVTLSECGAIPAITNMMQGGDMWSWFMPWYGDYMTDPYNSSVFMNTLMNSDMVITRDELPELK